MNYVKYSASCFERHVEELRGRGEVGGVRETESDEKNVSLEVV